MKKTWRKLHRQELLLDFIMFALLVFLGGCFLTSLIIKTAGNPVILAWNVRVIGLSVAVVFIFILLAGISFYKLSASYIRWYKVVLDSVPKPVIVTDKKARLIQVNKTAWEIMKLQTLEKLNCKHLIGADGGVMEKTWIHNGTKYLVTGDRLCLGGEDAGYLIFLNDAYVIPDSRKTRIELIDEINRLMKHLSTATDQFKDCASTFADCTVRQAGIINELSDVIVGIASGAFHEPDDLNDKMYAVKVDMQQHAESSQASLETMKRTIEELDAARNFISGVVRDIDSAS